MVAFRHQTNAIRARALSNFLQNHPRLFTRLAMTEEDNGLCGSAIAGEINKTRNRAIYSLIEKCDLSLDQLNSLTLKDIDLVHKTIHIKRRNGSAARLIAIDNDSARVLAHYLRHRLPTDDGKIFILEQLPDTDGV